jgi:hypothetical protein
MLLTVQQIMAEELAEIRKIPTGGRVRCYHLDHLSGFHIHQAVSHYHQGFRTPEPACIHEYINVNMHSQNRLKSCAWGEIITASPRFTSPNLVAQSTLLAQ